MPTFDLDRSSPRCVAYEAANLYLENKITLEEALEAVKLTGVSDPVATLRECMMYISPRWASCSP